MMRLALVLAISALLAAPLAAGNIVNAYMNARFGTILDIPSEGYDLAPPPENGDGQVFEARDGSSTITVYANHNALDQTLEDLRDQAAAGMDEIVSAEIAGNRVRLAGARDGRQIVHAQIIDAQDVIHAVEVAFDPAIAPEMKEMLSDVVSSLRVAQPMKVVAASDFHTPEKGSNERAAIMDAARGPISQDIGQTVIFLVSVLRSDDEWAFLQATPVNPDGSPLDWSTTKLAEEWAGDMMSDTIMVLLRKRDGAWKAVDHVTGPTDVHWINWVEQYGLPELLFMGD